MDPRLTLPPLNVPALLRVHGLSPKQSLGQNFLTDSTALERIIQVSEIDPNSTVLEVGPGLGCLTRYLAVTAHRVIAVELDSNLIPILEDVLNGAQNVTIIHGDILKIDLNQILTEPGYNVIANIPYYITSNLIRHLLEAALKPNRLVLTIQREVAKRITAVPGEMNLLGLSVQVYGHPRVAAHIPAGAFFPAPKVDSSVIRVDLYDHPLIEPGHLDLFFKLAKAGFSQKRKTLRNALSAGLAWSGTKAEVFLRSAGIDPQRRAETLALEEWSTLTYQLAAFE